MRYSLALIALLLALFFAPPAHAASVRKTSVAEMLESCAFIFEGRVIASGTEESDRSRHVFTWVDFAVLEVLKGPAVGASIRLHFLGGRIEDRGTEVAGMNVPQVGERGIYFVESLTRRQIHPLFGWDQGRLRLEAAEDGSLRVMSADGRPVVGIRAAPSADTGSGSAAARGVLGTGVAREVEVDGSASRDDAMTAWALKATLRRRLAGAPQ